ncbi:hypothetical protein [Bartonella acomydis]|uniref:hypothetical protein n=1 Tax=Bartonella acomydis TaxID=686234 RepID=UPI0031F0B176
MKQRGALFTHSIIFIIPLPDHLQRQQLGKANAKEAAKQFIPCLVQEESLS